MKKNNTEEICERDWKIELRILTGLRPVVQLSDYRSTRTRISY